MSDDTDAHRALDAPAPATPKQPDSQERRYERLNSSAIMSAEYDPQSMDMQVTFSGGQTYTVSNVSREEFDSLVRSPSPGRMWHAVFKGR